MCLFALRRLILLMLHTYVRIVLYRLWKYTNNVGCCKYGLVFMS